MRRTVVSRAMLLALTATLIGGLAASFTPTNASAEWYMTQYKAQKRMRQLLHYDLGYHHTASFCRPQGRSAPEPGYVYHRWTCSWLTSENLNDGTDCKGQTLLLGKHQAGGWFYRGLWSRGTCSQGAP